MFTLNAQTRRLLCRGGFLILCALPTIALGAWGIARRLPSHRAAVERRLGGVLDVEVSIGHLTHPRPGVDVLENVTFRDRGNGEKLAQVARLDVSRNGTTCVLLASDLQLEAEALEHLWPSVLRSLRRGSAERYDIRLVVPHVVLGSGPKALKLAEVSGSVRLAESESEADLHFREAEGHSRELASLHVNYLRDETRLTRVELHTGPAPLDVSLFAPLVDAAEWLGNSCRFRGSIWAVNGGADWESELAGHLEPVDLHQLVTTHFPHKLSGSAQVTLDRARLQSGRLVEASGKMLATGGVVSRSLVAGASHAFRIPTHLRNDVRGEMLGYDELAFTFHINSEGIALQGACDAMPQRAMLVNRQGVLLAEPQHRERLAQLINMLLPHQGAQVPATRQSEWLLRRLPIPHMAQSVANGRERSR